MKKLIFIILCIAVFLSFSVVYAKEGDRKWIFTAGGSIRSSPAIGPDGTIYFGSDDGKFYALNPSNGQPKWTYTYIVPGLSSVPISCSPAIGSDGTIYFGDDAGNFYALNPSDGHLKWQSPFAAIGKIYPSPAIGSDGTIYFGTDKGYLYAITPDRSLRWWEYVGGGGHIRPAIGPDGTIYISGYGFLSAINPNDGSLIWTINNLNIGGMYDSDASPSIGSDGTIYVGSINGMVYAFNPNKGDIKWHWIIASSSILTSPTIGSDGTIYVGSATGTLYALNPSTGITKWHYKVTGSEPMIYSSPAIGRDGTIYFGSFSSPSNLTAINPDDGSFKWSYETVNDLIRTSPAIGPDGTIYFGSDDGKLYALTSSSYGLAKSSWPMFYHDERHTGLYYRCNPDGTNYDGLCNALCDASINCAGAKPGKANTCCFGCYYTDIDNGLVKSVVDLSDLVLLSNAYGSNPGDSNWDSKADINVDGKVNLQDLVILSNYYGVRCKPATTTSATASMIASTTIGVTAKQPTTTTIPTTTIGVTTTKPTTTTSTPKISRRTSNQLGLTSDSEYYFLVTVITIIILIAILGVFRFFAKRE
jgi:outer membrane protein assembly factor BamB